MIPFTKYENIWAINTLLLYKQTYEEGMIYNLFFEGTLIQFIDQSNFSQITDVMLYLFFVSNNMK